MNYQKALTHASNDVAGLVAAKAQALATADDALQENMKLKKELEDANKRVKGLEKEKEELNLDFENFKSYLDAAKVKKIEKSIEETKAKKKEKEKAEKESNVETTTKDVDKKEGSK